MVVLKNLVVEKKLIHFPCCEIIKIELNDEFNFEHCITHLDELTVEFERLFKEVELMRPQINLFNNSMAVEIEKQTSIRNMSVANRSIIIIYKRD